MNGSQFTPVTIVRATAQSLHERYGYTRVVYRLSAPIPDAWIARFDAASQASGGSWPYDRPLALADRIEVLLPDRDHADRAALAAVKAQLETAIAAANREYGHHPPEETVPETPGLSWEQKVLTTLQGILDEQFPG